MLSAFRRSLPRLSPTRAVPLSSIPRALLRLPPKPTPSPKPQQGSSPTIDRLLASVAQKRRRATLAEDGRGLGSLREVGLGEEGESVAAAATEESLEAILPPNLRIEEFVPKRKEFSGVKAGHRELLQRLRREG